jgi:hypothetical protein
MVVTNQGPGGNSMNMVPVKPPSRKSTPGTYGELTPSQTNVGSGFNPKDPSNPSQGTGLTGYSGLNPATGMHVTTGSPYTPTNYPQQLPSGGGPGGGGRQIDMAAILKLLGGNKPTPYGPPKAYEYEDLVVPDYVGTGFREYDGSMYDTMRSGIAEGLAADARAGATAYGDARTELSQYQDPFTDRGYTQNQAMPAAMQRMLAANNVQLDPAEAARGGQADAAFGNVLALLGGNARQAQASNMRALAGDERRFGESLASEGRSMQFGVNMTESKAREQYNREKWQYGEDIARSNYEKNTQLAATNSTGRNMAGQSNTQATNEVNLANTRMGNESRDNNVNALIQLLASGQKIDPAALAVFMGG